MSNRGAARSLWEPSTVYLLKEMRSLWIVVEACYCLWCEKGVFMAQYLTGNTSRMTLLVSSVASQLSATLQKVKVQMDRSHLGSEECILRHPSLLRPEGMSGLEGYSLSHQTFNT